MASSTQTQQRHASDQLVSSNDPSIPFRAESNGTLRRRPSFSFLRRSKSQERSAPQRSVSGGKLTKKQRSHVREQEMLKEQIPQRPPKIPDLPPLPPALQSLGGEDPRPDSLAIISNRAGGYNYHPRTISSVSRASFSQPSPGMYSNVPIPPIPMGPVELNGEPVDSLGRTESMTNRGRYSYASSAVSTINNPRKMRRRKDPTPFNILIIGARHAGKTSFLEFLRKSLALPPRKQRPQFREDAYNTAPPVSDQAFPSFTSNYLETEVEGEHIGVTLWDSKGLESNIVDLQLREMAYFIDSKFQDTLTEELKVVRSPGVRDTHIHCAFLLLDPARLDTNIANTQKANSSNGNSFFTLSPASNTGALEEKFDLQVLRTLQGKTTVIPVIAKADTITTAHMSHLKRAVYDSLKRNNLDTLAALGLDEGGPDDRSDTTEVNGITHPHFIHCHDRSISNTSHLDSPSDSEKSFSASEFDLAAPSKHIRKPSASVPYSHTNGAKLETPYLPMSIISPDLYEPDVIGRKFPWGFADPYNAEHCDFQRLKDSVFSDWRAELREASREQWYEEWRSERLNSRQVEKEVVRAQTQAGIRKGSAKTFNGPLPSYQPQPEPRSFSGARF